jgi:sulfatase maturation enzyme AslB (radical SAM superfamily)
MNKAASIIEDQKFWNTTKHKEEKRNYDFVKNISCCDNVIHIDIVKKYIDQILEFHKTEFFKEYCTSKDAIILDFIGGDSLQYPDLLDQILTYFVRQLIKKNHKWIYSWKVSISSNGITLLNPKARQFCEKWKDNISLGLSIDGCPELHDQNRWCFADNEDGTHRGSWQYIKEIWTWYKRTFPSDSDRTKWTLAPNSYKYMFE